MNEFHTKCSPFVSPKRLEVGESKKTSHLCDIFAVLQDLSLKPKNEWCIYFSSVFVSVYFLSILNNSSVQLVYVYSEWRRAVLPLAKTSFSSASFRLISKILLC